MSNKNNTKSTPLDTWHTKHDGRMVRFGEYHLPLWYKSGAKVEHLAVLKSAGLFDTCHMSCLTVQGSDAFALLQQCYSRDLTSYRLGGKGIEIGSAAYGLFLREDGHLLDDGIILQLGEDDFFVCVNSGMGAKITNHLNGQKKWYNFKVTDLTGKLAKIDLQGPSSAHILAELISTPHETFGSFPYFSCKGHFDQASRQGQRVLTKDGVSLLISRTGYTGEFGFEIFVDSAAVVELWRQILIAGQQYNIHACGLAARDSLRVGACLPLAGQDIGDWLFGNTPWDFVLPFSSDKKSYTKEFIGDQALLSRPSISFTLPFAGFDLRKIEAGNNSKVLIGTGEQVGKVLTCVTDMGMDRVSGKLISVNSLNTPDNYKIRGVCCGFVKLDTPLPGGEIVTLKDKRREIKVEIVDDIRPDRTAALAMGTFI